MIPIAGAIPEVVSYSSRPTQILLHGVLVMFYKYEDTHDQGKPNERKHLIESLLAVSGYSLILIMEGTRQTQY